MGLLVSGLLVFMVCCFVVGLFVLIVCFGFVSCLIVLYTYLFCFYCDLCLGCCMEFLAIL